MISIYLFIHVQPAYENSFLTRFLPTVTDYFNYNTYDEEYHYHEPIGAYNVPRPAYARSSRRRASGPRRPRNAEPRALHLGGSEAPQQR